MSIPLALKCVQSFLKWAIDTGHTEVEYTLFMESANLSILALMSLMAVIVLSEPLRGGTLLRMIEARGHCLWMSRIRDSYRHKTRFTGCLVASLPPTCNTTHLGFDPDGIIWRIRLWTVGISAPRYMYVVAFIPIECRRGPRPWTRDVPIIIVSSAVVLYCCGWRDDL